MKSAVYYTDVMDGIIEKDKRSTKEKITSYGKILERITDDKILCIIIKNMNIPLEIYENILDKKISDNNVQNSEILKFLIRKDLDYIKRKLDELINDRTHYKSVLVIMTALYKINFNVYKEYVKKMDEQSLKFLLKENYPYQNDFQDKMIPVIESYIELNKERAIHVLKKVMKKWNNIVTFLDQIEGYIDDEIYEDLMDYFVSDKIFADRLIQYYFQLVSWRSRNKGGYGAITQKDVDKILTTITKASILGNTKLINKTIKFFADQNDNEMVEMIKGAAQIGG